MGLIDNIKALFSEVKFADVKTKDGAILRIEGELKEGAKASVIAEDGTVSDAPAKEYSLEDGTVITVVEKGVIEKIVEAVKEAEEEKIEEVKAAEEDEPAKEKAETPEEEQAEVDDVETLKSKVAELESAITMIAEQVKTLMDSGSVPAELAEIKKENKNLKKQVKELASEPATPPASFKKIELGVNGATAPTTKANITMSTISKLREEFGN